MWEVETGQRRQQGFRVLMEVCLFLWLAGVTAQVAVNSRRHEEQRASNQVLGDRILALEERLEALESRLGK